MRKLVTIRKILEIIPIPSADCIEIVKVGGWQCIAKKEEFKINDLCIYLEIDSFLPIKEEFEFLRKSCYKKLEDGTEGFRLKTIKLRGQLSQGLVLPLSMFPNIDFSDTKKDYAEELGVTKYEPPVPANLSGEVDGLFPTYLVPKTDEERIQNLYSGIQFLQKLEYEVTEKANGTSTTYIYNNGEFMVCSRNLKLKTPNENLTQYQIALRHDLENKLKNLNKNIAIQGELIGEGIQGNPYKIKGKEFYVFNMYDIDNKKYYDSEQRLIITKVLKLNHVPIIHKFFTFDKSDNLLEMASGRSFINPQVNREGLVFKSSTLGANIKSFKVISNEYLLKNEK
jgi:RNA ligase (TIGR02306 family)